MTKRPMRRLCKTEMIEGIKRDYPEGFLIEDSVRRLKGNSTIIWKGIDGDVRIRYQDTDILTFLNDGKGWFELVRLNSGGFRTATTKRRIDTYISLFGWRLYENKREWAVSNGDALNQAFFDSMVLKRQFYGIETYLFDEAEDVDVYLDEQFKTKTD